MSPVIGPPVRIKSRVVSAWFGATAAALALGNELTGKLMAPLVIIAAAITKSFGCPTAIPILATTGIVTSAQTVEDKKFATRPTKRRVPL